MKIVFIVLLFLSQHIAAQRAIDSIQQLVVKEHVNPLFNRAKDLRKEPDWDSLHFRIEKLYNGDIADRVVLDTRIRWFQFVNNGNEYCRYLIEKVDRYGAFGMFGLDFRLNNLAWEIFVHSTSKDQLEKALAWSDSAVALKPDPNWMDTKANLLYKLGRTAEAIQLQTKASAMGGPFQPDILKNLEKMTLGLPTWPVQ